MNRLIENVSMRHLMMISVGFILLGIVWMLGVWVSTIDSIWMVPGAFLIISGIIKMVAVQVWIRVAKLGTDEHKPIKAL